MKFRLIYLTLFFNAFFCLKAQEQQTFLSQQETPAVIQSHKNSFTFFQLSYFFDSYPFPERVSSRAQEYPTMRIQNRDFNVHHVRVDTGLDYKLFWRFGASSGLFLQGGRNTGERNKKNYYTDEENAIQRFEKGRDIFQSAGIGITQSFYLNFCSSSTFCFRPFIEGGYEFTQGKSFLTNTVKEQKAGNTTDEKSYTVISRELSFATEANLGLKFVNESKQTFSFIRGGWKEWHLLSRKSSTEKSVANLNPRKENFHQSNTSTKRSWSLAAGFGLYF